MTYITVIIVFIAYYFGHLYKNITPETSVPEWHGEQMDNGVAVDMLLQCD